MQRKIEINCDMGESFGIWSFSVDNKIMPYITSANVACGFHAGDPVNINKAIELAHKFGVAVGAHVGYPDLLGFGRRNIKIQNLDLKCYIKYQVGALREFLRCYGMELHHIKPHGAMYMMAAVDPEISRVIAEATLECGNPFLYTMPNSITEKIAKDLGVRVIRELYADRGYKEDGNFIFEYALENIGGSVEKAAERVLQAVQTGKMATVTGNIIEIAFESICIHSDTPDAIPLIKKVRELITDHGFEVAPSGI